MLNQAETHLAALIESSEDLIWAVDLNYRLTTFNSALSKHVESNFGVQVEVGMDFLHLHSSEKVVLWTPFYERALSEGTFRTEYSLLFRSTLELTFNPIVIEGKPTGVSVFGRDVTQRKVTEESGRLTAGIVESSDDAIHAANLDGIVVGWNHGAEVLLDYKKEEILGKCISILAPPGRGGEVPQLLDLIEKGGAISPFDTVLRRKDGCDIDVSLSLSPIRDSGGNIVGVSAIARDIGDRKRAAQALVDSEATLRRFFEQNSSVMFLVDPSSGAIVSANRAAANYYGLPQEKLIGLPTGSISDSPPEESERRIQQVLCGERRVFSYRIRLASGEERDIETHSSRIDVDGLPRLFVILHDVSERKRAEESLRESEELLQDAQRIAGFGSYVLDIPAEVWTSSDLMDEIYGIDKNYLRTLVGWTALIHPDDRAIVNAYFAGEVLSKGKQFDKEYRIIRQTDLAERWVHGIGRLEFDPDGRPLKMRGIVQDITENKRAEMQLRDTAERYRSTFEQAAVGMIHTSMEGRILRSNARFAEIIGYPVEEIPGMTFQQITVQEDLANSNRVLRRMTVDAAGEDLAPTIWEKRYIRKDGSLTWVRLTVSIQRDSEGRAIHYISVIEDINARKAAEASLASALEALRASENRYHTVFQTSLDCIALSSLSDGRYIDVNKAFLDVMGYKYEEIIGRTSLGLDFWADPDARVGLVDMLRRNSRVWDQKTRFKKRNGEIFWVMISASVIELDGAPCILSVLRDISDAKAAEDKIWNLAFYDPLTRLPNRRLLMDRLRQTLEISTQPDLSHALLFIDLDDFKTLNDTLGHQTGDLLLQDVAARLGKCIRQSDTVARLGGDEFVVMLEGLSGNAEEAARQAEAIGGKILAAVDQPYRLGDHECRSTSSIGITMFGHEQESTNEILQQADMAMYQAKAAGRNTMRFFAPALQTAVNARAAMEIDLRQALKTDQFVLYFQPQVDSTGLIGAEALVRWKHPARGLLAPGKFIPLAEETGLILSLGNWVLETACRQIADWASRSQTSQISVSVNISALQFRHPDFVGQVLRMVDTTCANPYNLKLELTESMLVDNIEDVIAKVTQLKSHGIGLSLDDFGTGYSSLAYLKRLPFDQLKIDCSFVRDIVENASSRAIAQSILSLGKAMGLKVIAEGVETEEQRDCLAQLGCQSFQGYLFSCPIPLDEFELMLPVFRDVLSTIQT